LAWSSLKIDYFVIPEDMNNLAPEEFAETVGIAV
jgi:hypothetical protein